MASPPFGTPSKWQNPASRNTHHSTERDFSRTDIRGVKWNQANLEQVKFCSAYAGLSSTRTLSLRIFLAILAAFGGISAGITSLCATYLLSSNNISEYTALPGIVVYAFVFIAAAVVVGTGFTGLFTLCIPILFGSVVLALFIQNESEGWVNFLFGMVITTVAQIVTLQTGGVVSTVDRSLPRSIVTVLGTATIVGAMGSFVLTAKISNHVTINALNYSVVIGLLLASLTIGWRAAQLNGPFSEIRQWAIALTAIGGTSFRGANLTEADFSQAKLKYTDFRNANLTRAYWHGASGLEFARLDNTYLNDPRIRQLAVTLSGQQKNFDGANLEGVNLKEANLSRTSFASVNLRNSNLQNANLFKAILWQAQMDGTDLSDANLRESILARADLANANLSRADLTGACIKDWNFNAQTCFVGITCDYIYREYENRQFTDRYPSDRNFKPGEFESLYQKVINSVELIFQDQVDWRALSFAFEKFQIEDDGMGLELKGVEQRGDYWIVKVAHGEGVSKQQVEQQVQSTYDDLRALMEAKDQQINQLLGIVDGQTKAMNQQAEALSNFSQHPFGNNFFISGSTITNLAGSGQIEYQEAANRVRRLVSHADDPAFILQRLIMQLTDQNVATTPEAQQELIQQVLLSEAERDAQFRRFLLQQGQQIVDSLPNERIATSVRAAIAHISPES